jgi:20S proteasome alpha/beta subunit
LKEDIKKYGKDKFKRFIISLHDSVGKTNYEETKQLFINNVLIESLDDNTPRFYNSNILGRYYRKDYFDYPLDKT